jgi:Holliday junction resolvase-like predicted endonuclease
MRLRHCRAGRDMRFDVVLTAPWSWPHYIENAFSI